MEVKTEAISMTHTPKDQRPREWTAGEIYVKWFRHEQKEMPGSFIKRTAYEKAVNALKRIESMCSVTSEVGTIARQTLRELGEEV